MGSQEEKARSKAAAGGPSGPTFPEINREDQLGSKTDPQTRAPALGNKASNL